MGNNKLKISVVTVSYNAAETIEETIQSVVNQTYDNIEYIIIDGGSTDGTVDIIKRYADRLAYWVSEPDKGIYDAMNKGLRAANGHYVYFLGADDIIADENVFCRLVKAIGNDSHSIYYSNVKFKHSGEIYPGPIKTNYRICLDNFSHQAIFYPAHIYKNKCYNTNYKLWADYVYNIELFADKINTFRYIEDVIAIFSCEGRGSIQSDTLFNKDRIKIVERLFGKRLAIIIYVRIKLGKLYKLLLGKRVKVFQYNHLI